MGNRLRELWSSGGTAVGAWCLVPAFFNAELFATAGFDYVGIDCQHGLVGYEGMVAMLHSIARTPATPIVRVPSNDAAWIGKALDAGAEGVIVPMVNSADDAARVAAACRYPPDGIRSFGPSRAQLSLGADPRACNREVLCLPMVETAEALACVDAIARTPGVDGIYVGPSDLAVSMGLPPGLRQDAPEHAEAVETIRRACADAGIVSGIHCGSGAQARERAQAGFRMVTATSDVGLLGAGASRELRVARDGG